MTAKKPRSQHKKNGRPTVMTGETIKKLEEAFSIGASDREATFYAGISLQTLYDYQKRVPKFIERKAALKERLVLRARETVEKNIRDPKVAQWYLERKVKDEFSMRTENINENTNIEVKKTIEDKRDDSNQS